MQKTAFGCGTFIAFLKAEKYRGLTKTLLVMKLTIFFILLAFFQVQASGTMAQTVSISGKEMSLKQVFADIEKQTDYVLMYPKGTFDKSKTVTLTVHKMPLKEFLDFLLKEEELDYEIQGKIIMLSRKKENSNELPPGSIRLYEENEPISGVVTNEAGQPLSGVSIFLKRSNKGTYTNANGRFVIQANIGDTLVFSFVGYAGQTVKIPSVGMHVKLKVAHSLLDEMQVTVYGKTSKRLATGSINTIKGEDIEKQPVFNVLQALAGRAPGVSVRPTSGNTGAPVEVVIRGMNSITPNTNNDPLYVIDGLPLSNLNISNLNFNRTTGMGAVQAGLIPTVGESPLNRINPMDIESMTVLKDADATAIYGSRGANGVILITTKKGKTGPASFNVSVQNGLVLPMRLPRIMNTKEYLAVRREAFQNDGVVPNLDNAPDLVSWDSTRNKDYRKELIGTGVNNSINIGLSGGTGLTTYRINANYGAITTLLNAGGKNQRMGFSSSFTQSTANQKLSYALLNSLSYVKMDAIRGRDPSSLSPNAPEIYTENGDFNFEPYRKVNSSIFPFSELRQPSENNTLTLQSSLNIEYKIISDLSIRVSGAFGLDQNDNNYKVLQASVDPKFAGVSNAVYGNSKSSNWQIGTELAYRTFIGKGSLTAQLITEYTTVAVASTQIIAAGFPNDAMMKSWNNSNRLLLSASEAKGYNKILKFTGLINYNWANKYILNLSGTRDGSPHFGEGKRFGNFGSAAMAWIASEEKWMKSLLPSWFSMLKFRGSFGLTGSSSIPPYENISRWSRSIVDKSTRLLFEYNGVTAFHVIKPLNQEYHWVSTRKAEIAFDAGFFGNRLNISGVTYKHSSTAQLLADPIALYTGFSSVFTNTYSNLRNTGAEFQIDGDLLRKKDWSLNVSFNIGWNRNKLVGFPNLENSPHKGRLKVGYSNSTVFVLKYTGINPLNGSYTFEDHNKDGKINRGSVTNFPVNIDDDRFIPIERADKYSGGGSVSFNYKSLSITGVFDFVNRLRKDPYISIIVGSMSNMALPDDILNNHWKQPGDIVKYPRFSTGDGLGPIAESDAMYIKGGHIRLNTVNISYRLPGSWISRFKMKGASISFSADNLVTFTPYAGLDPRGEELTSATPLSRTISTSLNIQF